jgi:uncharacterized protein (TIRG00374 family)
VHTLQRQLTTNWSDALSLQLNTWKPFARVALSAAVIAAIVATARLEHVLEALAEAHEKWIALGLAVNLLTRLFAAERTYAISRGVGLPLTRMQTVDAMFVANFWSLVLPGISAGSVATVYRYSRYGASIAAGVGVLSASRAIELAMFCALGAAAFAWSPHQSNTQVVIALCSVPFFILGAFILARRFAVRVRGTRAERRIRFQFAQKMVDIATRAWIAFSSAPSKQLVAATGFALTQGVLDAASVVAFAWSLNLDISWRDALWINALSYLAILLPISLAGLGVREVTIIIALAPLGIPKEAAIALAVLMFSATLLNALIGGVLQLFVQPRSGVALAPRAASTKE